MRVGILTHSAGTRWTMTDPVLGNAARWHDTSPLYGENLTVPFGGTDGTISWHWTGLATIGQFVARAFVSTGDGGGLDASRHDL